MRVERGMLCFFLQLNAVCQFSSVLGEFRAKKERKKFFKKIHGSFLFFFFVVVICFITSKGKDANHPHKRASFTRSQSAWVSLYNESGRGRFHY